MIAFAEQERGWDSAFNRRELQRHRDVALFLPFWCHNEPQIAATAGTKRSSKID
jgi:hypothetical protein